MTSGNVTPWPASGRRGAEADDARPREVRLCHSSGEVAEQNRGTGSGGDGAKGGGRGEREPATHAPDTEPGKRVTDAGARTDGRKVLPSLSEVGAGCGKAARPVLGGGTRVTRFPTAIALPPFTGTGAKDPLPPYAVIQLRILNGSSCPEADTHDHPHERRGRVDCGPSRSVWLSRRLRRFRTFALNDTAIR